MGQFLDFISNFIVITGNDTADGIILVVIGILAFLYAFGIVDAIFDFLGVYNAGLMSGVHWIVRVAVFLGLSLLCIGIAKIVAFLCSFQWWVYLIIGLLAVTAAILIIVLKKRFKKKKRLDKEKVDNIKQ